ncbi:MAG: sigma-70 family RNA polymerase sigma factor [candidate division Zixibacteria bacterium]|nr:sigma-70 family RNA polymerase sigma factor [candidate division Zixibacteria bacterium]
MESRPDPTLEPLVLAAKAGDQKAFGEIVRKLMNPVMALTYRMTGDRDVASDLAQETFVTAWEELSHFRGQSSVKSWVWRIAANRSLNYLESLSRRRTHELTNISEDIAAPGNIHRELEQDELRRGVLAFMSTLPPQQRLVFELRFYQQMSFEEISQAMDRALGTVKTLYREAIGKLRAHAKQSGWRS